MFQLYNDVLLTSGLAVIGGGVMTLKYAVMFLVTLLIVGLSKAFLSSAYVT